MAIRPFEGQDNHYLTYLLWHCKIFLSGYLDFPSVKRRKIWKVVQFWKLGKGSQVFIGWLPLATHQTVLVSFDYTDWEIVLLTAHLPCPYGCHVLLTTLQLPECQAPLAATPILLFNTIIALILFLTVKCCHLASIVLTISFQLHCFQGAQFCTSICYDQPKLQRTVIAEFLTAAAAALISTILITLVNAESSWPAAECNPLAGFPGSIICPTSCPPLWAFWFLFP